MTPVAGDPYSFLLLFSPPPDFAARVIWIIVVAYGVLTLGWLAYQGIRVGRELGWLDVNLKRLSQQPASSDRLEKLSGLMERHKRFKNRWQEFEATLLQRDGECYTTLEPATFFHEGVLVEHPLHYEFVRHVPGMLTALGIIGTFSGLITGLQGFDEARLQESIQTLLHGIENAFSCSFVAVLLAVLVTATERSFVTWLLGFVVRIQDHLTRFFHRSVAEHTLDRMVGQLAEQKAALGSLLDDLATRVEQAVRSIPTEQEKQLQAMTASMVEQQQAMVQRMSQEMSQILAPALGDLRTTLVDIAQAQANSHQDGLKDLIEQFGAALQNSTGKHMDSVAQVMQEAGTRIEAVGSVMSRAVEDMRAQQAATFAQWEQSRMKAEVEERERHSAQQQRLADHLEALTRQMAASQESMQTRSGEVLSRLAERLSAIADGAQARQSETLARLEERIVGMHMDLDAKLTESLQRTRALFEDVSRRTEADSEVTRAAGEHMVSRLQQQQAELAAAMQNVTSAMQEGQLRTQQDLQGTVSQVGQYLVALVSKLEQELGRRQEEGARQLAENQQETTQAISAMLAAAREAASRTQETVESRSTAIVEALGERTSDLVAATSSLAQDVGAQQAVIRQAIGDLMTAVRVGQQAWNQQQDALLSRQHATLEAHSRLLEAFDVRLRSHADLMGRVEDALSRLSRAGDGVSQAAGAFEGIVGTVGTMASESGRHAQRVAESVVALQGLTTSLDQQLQRHGQFLGRVGEDADSLLRGIHEGLEGFREVTHRTLVQYNELTAQNLGDYLGQVETALGQAVGKLSAAIAELSEGVEDIADLRQAGRK